MTKHKRTPSAKSAPKTVTIAIPKELHTALVEHMELTGQTRKFMLARFVREGIIKDLNVRAEPKPPVSENGD